MTAAALPAVHRRTRLGSLGLALVLLAAMVAVWSGAGGPARAANPTAANPTVANLTGANPAGADVGRLSRALGDAALTVEVTGVRTARGVVRVAVCTAQTFLKDACPYTASSPATVGATVVTVPGVPPGVYAVQLFHDENDNDRVDRGLFGVPTEPIGFSNDAAIGLKGPSFAKAAFSHAEGTQTLKVALRRLAPGLD